MKPAQQPFWMNEQKPLETVHMNTEADTSCCTSERITSAKNSLYSCYNLWATTILMPLSDPDLGPLALTWEGETQVKAV